MCFVTLTWWTKNHPHEKILFLRCWQWLMAAFAEVFGLTIKKLSFVSRLLCYAPWEFHSWGLFLFLPLGHCSQQPHKILSNSLQNSKPTCCRSLFSCTLSLFLTCWTKLVQWYGTKSMGITKSRLDLATHITMQRFNEQNGNGLPHWGSLGNCATCQAKKVSRHCLEFQFLFVTVKTPNLNVYVSLHGSEHRTQIS